MQPMEKKKNNLKTTKTNPQARVIFWLVFIILIIGLGSYAFPSKLGQRRPAWESRAKSTLRSTGSSQLGYQNTNDLNNYGSFQALVDTMYIAEGYTQGNMIEGYSMSWEIGSSSVRIDSFTIIAFPRDTRKGYLNTFAITEDQIVRVYEPGPEHDFNSIKTWDPIL